MGTSLVSQRPGVAAREALLTVVGAPALIVVLTVAAHAWAAHLRSAAGATAADPASIHPDSVWLWSVICIALWWAAIGVSVIARALERRETLARLTRDGAP